MKLVQYKDGSLLTNKDGASQVESLKFIADENNKTNIIDYAINK